MVDSMAQMSMICQWFWQWFANENGPVGAWLLALSSAEGSHIHGRYVDYAQLAAWIVVNIVSRPTLNSHWPPHCSYIDPTIDHHIAPTVAITLPRRCHHFIVVIAIVSPHCFVHWAWFIVLGHCRGHWVGSLGMAMRARYDVEHDFGSQSYVINQFVRYMRPPRPYKTIFIGKPLAKSLANHWHLRHRINHWCSCHWINHWRLRHWPKQCQCRG